MADDGFGEIKIDPDFPKGARGRDFPLSSHKDSDEASSLAQPEVLQVKQEGRGTAQRRQKSGNFILPLPSRRTVAWFLLIPLMVVVYGVGSYFLVPLVINSLLAANVSRHFDRPVDVGRIIYSPFTFELLVNDVTIGPEQGDKTGKELLVLKNGRFQFSFRRIFDGKPVFMRAMLDGLLVNLVRRQKVMAADLEMISDLFLSPSTDLDILYWPGWLYFDEVKLNGGTILIDDRQAKKVFTIEDIQFYLPSAATRESDKTALPHLRGVMDSSPFEVDAVRFRNQSGAWRTGFSFEFKKLIMNNFKELLPLPETGLRLSEGEVDIKLDIILPEDKHGPDSIVVEGEAILRGGRWEDSAARTVLVLPTARIVYHAVPANRRIRLSAVEFQEPVLSFPAGKKKTAATGPLPAVAYLETVLEKISRADEALEIENFLWNNGRVVMAGGPSGGKIELNDVSFAMKNFTTEEYRRAHPDGAKSAFYTFRAKDISTKKGTDFNAEGQFHYPSTLSGTLSITGLDTARYPTLLPKSLSALSKGIADISFHYEYAGAEEQGVGKRASRNKISNGAIKTTGYILKSDGKTAAEGKMLDCRGFSFDMVSRVIVCDQLELTGSEIFTDSIFAQEAGKENIEADNWRIKINNLSVSDSSIHTTLSGFASAENTPLVAHEVSIEGKNLQAEKVTDNIKGSARIGNKGKLTISGSYSPLTGQGRMQMDIREMELSLLRPYFSTWFVPKLNSGIFSATGMLQFPDREFKGKVRVDELEAGEGSGARISWKQALANDCTYRSAPLFIAADELLILQPSLDPGLSSGGKPVDKYLRLTDKKLPQEVRIGSIRVQDGQLSLSEPIFYPGYQPLLRNINATISPVNETEQQFSVTGAINDRSNFTLLGTSSSNSIVSYKLDVHDFPLLPFDAVLKKEAGFSGLQAVISVQQEMSHEANLVKVNTDIVVRDIFPPAIGFAAPILSLIVNQDRFFTMKMEEQYSADKPAPFLLEQLINRLRHLQVKAAISPRLVLKSTLPALDLPEDVGFAPGSAEPEETVSLSGFQELLRMRPYTMLSLRGQYDPVVDREKLQGQLQEEADRQREIENKRRAMEKIKILQEEKRRLKELKEGAPAPIIEEIVPADSTENLQPLPRVKVPVDPARLEALAMQRALNLQNYLLNRLQLDPDRIKLDKKAEKGASMVRIDILPYVPLEGT